MQKVVIFSVKMAFSVQPISTRIDAFLSYTRHAFRHTPPPSLPPPKKFQIKSFPQIWPKRKRWIVFVFGKKRISPCIVVPMFSSSTITSEIELDEKIYYSPCGSFGFKKIIRVTRSFSIYLFRNLFHNCLFIYVVPNPVGIPFIRNDVFLKLQTVTIFWAKILMWGAKYG